MKTMMKTGPDVKHQFEWFSAAPPHLVPHGLGHADGTLMYNYVEGHAPVDWRPVIDAAIQLWFSGDGPMLHIDCKAYAIYVLEKSKAFIHDRRWNDLLLELTTARHELCPVRRCHGDMTLYNCVQRTDGSIVFLDPGYPRGLPCVELDESKVLQSLDGFGVVYRGEPQPVAYPKMHTRRVHWILLATHYARLLHHVEHALSQQFALQRIWEIIECLTH